MALSTITPSVGQPYINAANAIGTQTGAWIPIGSVVEALAFEFVFSIGAGNVTGAVTIQYSAQMNGAISGAGTQLLLPNGSLHTSLTQATLASAPNPSTQVTLTALVAGRFSVILSKVPPGQVRAIYTYTSGTGASPNQLTVYCAAG
jgi:hypothetical protein